MSARRKVQMVQLRVYNKTCEECGSFHPTRELSITRSCHRSDGGQFATKTRNYPVPLQREMDNNPKLVRQIGRCFRAEALIVELVKAGWRLGVAAGSYMTAITVVRPGW